MTAVAMNMTASAAGTIYTVMKELYEGQKPQELYVKKWPLLSLLRTNEKIGGRGWPVPFIAGPAVGSTATFSSAQSDSAPGLPGEFLVTTSDIFQSAYLDAKTLAAARNDKQSFVNALEFNMSGAIAGCTKRLAISLFRPSYGVLGTISSITSGVATLTKASDCLNFEVGQFVRASSASDGTSLLAAATSGGHVLSINRVNGTVTFDDTGNGTAGTAAIPGTNNGTAWSSTYCYLYNDGDATLCMHGMLDWCPSTDPVLASDSFFGVNRGKFKRERVAGHYYNGATRQILEAILNASAFVYESGGTPKVCVLSPISLQGLINEINQRGMCDWGSAKGSEIEVSFDGVKIRSVCGPIVCVADPACPAATAFLLDPEHMFLGSIGPSVSVFNEDGLPFLRDASANRVELRVNSYSQIYCDEPQSLATIALQF